MMRNAGHQLRHAAILLGITACLTSVAVAAETKIIHKFGGGADGVNLQEKLVADSTGTIFGTTYQGGVSGNCSGLGQMGGCGTVFKKEPGTNKIDIIHRFPGIPTGVIPGGVIHDGVGGLYGLTYYGGAVTDDCAYGCGTIFRLTPAEADQPWTHTVLHKFKAGKNPQYPKGSLVMDKNGALYGVSTHGGGHDNCAGFPDSCGTVFQLRPKNAAKTVWEMNVIHRFTGGADGAQPESSLALDKKTGELYGVTSDGGDTSCFNGCGVVFKLVPPASAGGKWKFVKIHSFTAGAGGNGPYGAPALGNGVLYGATIVGGAKDEGVVFRLRTTPPFTKTVLHSFVFDEASGPTSGVILANGALYGTAFGGGKKTAICPLGCGTVFELKPPTVGGKLTTLYRFNGFDGANPDAAVTAVKGKIFGGTVYGGNFSACKKEGCGVMFEITR